MQDTTSSGAPDRHGAVDLLGVSRRFGDTLAVDALELHVEPGEFLSLLGPSGCGKTTTLRLIAGFEQPDAGEVRISGRPVTGLPPYRRDVNTVFQAYALFPHLSVAENVAYGLQQKRVGRTEVRERVADALSMVQMREHADRKPTKLSGGQQQRVALARALVNRPSVLLLDEPLGALDRQLREEMQLELKLLQERLGTTFVFVTHDQGEALAMSDRVAVMRAGRIEQLDAPRAIYDAPASAYVAAFVGQQNFLDAHTAIRPEAIAIGADPMPGEKAAGTVLAIAHLGEVTQFLVGLADDRRLLVRRPSRDAPELGLGRAVHCAWDEADLLHFADGAGAAIPAPLLDTATAP
ncbi:MAG: ABC transporter ATP-binding protein [Actinomycetales bacterium]|nr:ABC transporter ATP-binding protein [Actinomycetales bacterium]